MNPSHRAVRPSLPWLLAALSMIGPFSIAAVFPAFPLIGARFAVVVGGEWPEVKVKTLATRAEETIGHAQLADWLGKPIPSPSSSC